MPEDNGVLELPDNHGSGVKIIGAGTVMVTAAIAGDEKYNGTTVTRKITIGKAAASADHLANCFRCRDGQFLKHSCPDRGKHGIWKFYLERSSAAGGSRNTQL